MTPWTTAHQASLSITNSRSLLKLMSIELVMPFSHLILCRLLLPPSIFPSIRWPKYWSFSFSISPSNEYSGLIDFRMDWVALRAVQGAQIGRGDWSSDVCLPIWVFSNQLALRIRWPKCWSFSFSISPSNEYSGLISFRDRKSVV